MCVSDSYRRLGPGYLFSVVGSWLDHWGEGGRGGRRTASWKHHPILSVCCLPSGTIPESYRIFQSSENSVTGKSWRSHWPAQALTLTVEKRPSNTFLRQKKHLWHVGMSFLRNAACRRPLQAKLPPSLETSQEGTLRSFIAGCSLCSPTLACWRNWQIRKTMQWILLYFGLPGVPWSLFLLSDTFMTLTQNNVWVWKMW